MQRPLPTLHQKVPPSDPPSRSKRLAASLVALFGADIAVNGVKGIPQHALARSMEAAADSASLTAGEVAKMEGYLGLAGKDIVYSEPFRDLGSRFSPWANSVVARKARPDIFAHELGHAANFLGKSRVLKGVQGVGAVGKLVAGTLPLLAAAASADDDSRTGRAAKYLPAVAAVAMAPVLAEEAIATARGYAALNSVRGTTAARKMLRVNAKGLASYGLAAGAAVASPLAIRKVKKLLLKSRPND